MNIHTPQRGASESRGDYIGRRKAHHAIVAAGNPQGGSKTSREMHREQRKRNGKLKGSYGQDLINAFATMRQAECEKKHPCRDVYGAVTMIGSRHPIDGTRRVWLGGISAMRNY